MYYKHLNESGEGLDWNTQAWSNGTSNLQSLLARCHLYLGIGYNLQAAENHLKQQK